MISIAQTLLWLGLVGLAFFNPPLGAMGLLSGYALADKPFALINAAALIGLPLFVTEAVLIALIVRAIPVSVREGAFQNRRALLNGPWFWFYAVGIFNILLGLVFSGPIPVFRDAVIVFYGCIAQLTFVYVKETRHVRNIFFFLVGSMLLRLVLEIFFPLFDHGSSAFGMYSAFVIIGCLCTLPLWGRFKPLALVAIVLFVGLTTATEIRTVWVALFIAYWFVVAIHRAARVPARHLLQGTGAILSSIVLTLLILKVGYPQRYDVTKNEFLTMFAGRNSPNLMARVAMWEDAIEQVVPLTGVLFDAFDRKILNPYYYGSETRPTRQRTDLAARKRALQANHEITATDILTKYATGESSADQELGNDGLGKAYQPGSEYHGWRGFLYGNAPLRQLLGVPFGRSFIPERISHYHHVDRYDPHNSLIAIFYRTGFFGFSLFLIIVGTTFSKAFSAVKASEDPELKSLLLALMSCGVYHLGHSLTDVTLENPFRGGPFWLVLGLLMAVTSMVRKKAPQP